MKISSLYLLSAVAEPKARKAVAQAYGIPSGTIPVLAAIGFRDNEGGSTCPREIYEAKLGAETLIRSYLGVLVKVQLVERYNTGRVRRIRLTVKGLMAIKQYERALQQGVVAFGQTRPIRVLTRPVAVR